MPKTASAQDVLDFGFSESQPEQWYKKDPPDETIRSRFEDTITAALSARLTVGRRALIACADPRSRPVHAERLSRHAKGLYRDGMALALSLRCVDRGFRPMKTPPGGSSC